MGQNKQEMVVDDVDSIINTVIERPEGDGPPLVVVRADILIPMLVYLRKLFAKMDQTNRNAISRFVDPDDFVLQMVTRGFTPEDFNALMSLSNTMGTEMKAYLDELAAKTPQMARPEVRKKMLPSSKPAPRLALVEGVLCTLPQTINQTGGDDGREEKEKA